MLSYGSSGFFVDPARTLIKPDPIISMIPRPAPLIPGLMPPIKAPIHASQIDSRYPQKSVNMRRALGFAMLMSCLCPPIGLVGLGTACKCDFMYTYIFTRLQLSGGSKVKTMGFLMRVFVFFGNPYYEINTCTSKVKFTPSESTTFSIPVRSAL